MKIVLLQPPVQDFYDTDIRLQPIGLGYLKSSVKKHLPDVDVVVRDFHHGFGRRTITAPSELDYLKPYYYVTDRSPFSTFSHYYHFGASFDAIGRAVAEEKPDLVGISSLFSPYYREVLSCAEAIKRACSVPIVLGGSHVSACPEMMLSHPFVDFVIVGEGERPFVELLKAWCGDRRYDDVPNLGFKRNGELVFTERQDNFALDEIPSPDLSDLELQRYTFEGKPLSFVVTSRSCPHRCTFCSVHTTFGLNYRRHSPKLVLEELRARYREGIRVFDFEDDNLTFYLREMKQLCRDLIEAFPRRDVQFLAMNGISYLSVDDELLDLMREAGFTHLNLSLVSSDKTVRETTKRPHTLEKYLHVVETAHRLGMNIVSYQIFGLPSETIDSMVQTLCVATELPVLLGASLFYLTPRSPIARQFPERSPEEVLRSRLTAMAIQTVHVERDDLYTLLITTRILNFLKGLSFPDREIALSDLFERRHTFVPREILGFDLLEALLQTGVLYAATRNGNLPRTRFKRDLFTHIWQRLSTVRTQRGHRIHLH